MKKVAIGLLIFGFFLIFYTNFLGLVFSDEGMAVLEFTPKQEIGITFSYYQYLIRTLFPNGLDLILARQIRLGLIILSSAVLLFSVYKSRLKGKYFFYFALLLSATTLISVCVNIRVLSYNGLNQFIMTLYAACLVQYTSQDQNRRKALSLLIPIGILIGLTYLIKLPSFPLYIIFQIFLIFFLYQKRGFLLHITLFLASLFGMIFFLNSRIFPFDVVVSNLLTFERIASNITVAGHGFMLTAINIFSFIRLLPLLFFAAVASYVLNMFINALKDKLLVRILKILLILGVASVFIIPTMNPPISIHTFVVFFFFLLLVSFFGTIRCSVDLFKERRRFFLAAYFLIITVVSTLGSSIEIINALLFYSPIWSVGYLFFVSGRNAQLFKKICYIIVLLAFVRVLQASLIDVDNMKGTMLDNYYEYKPKTHSSVFLDEPTYRFVTEVRDFLETNGLYGKDIMAINGSPGLVYLLDSKIPGSVNVNSGYWKLYCDNLPVQIEVSIIMLNNTASMELSSCLINHGINIANDYQLVKVIDDHLNNRIPPTYIYIKKHLQ